MRNALLPHCHRTADSPVLIFIIILEWLMVSNSWGRIIDWHAVDSVDPYFKHFFLFNRQPNTSLHVTVVAVHQTDSKKPIITSHTGHAWRVRKLIPIVDVFSIYSAVQCFIPTHSSSQAPVDNRSAVNFPDALRARLVHHDMTMISWTVLYVS